MDPVSISAFVASILPIAQRVAAGIFGFAVEAHRNSETLNTFASEVLSLTRVLEAATSTINDANFPAQPDGGPSANVHRALHGAVDDIRLYLERLQSRVQRIQGKRANRDLYRTAIRTLATRINRTGINELRSLLQTHQLSLNTALVMVHLYHATHEAGHQHVDLRPDIYRLTSIVQRLATAVGPERLSDDLTDDRIRDLQGVALQVVEEASQTAASTAASETGEPVDPRERRRIDEWLNQVSEGSYKTDLGSRDSNEASTRHWQITEIRSQRSTLHRSSLGLGGDQTQPISATTNTGRRRRSLTSNHFLKRIFLPPMGKYLFRAYQTTVGLALMVFAWAIICLLTTYEKDLIIPTLVTALIMSLWCVLRLGFSKTAIGYLGSIFDWFLG